jgi:hypothetical protein
MDCEEKRTDFTALGNRYIFTGATFCTLLLSFYLGRDRFTARPWPSQPPGYNRAQLLLGYPLGVAGPSPLLPGLTRASPR